MKNIKPYNSSASKKLQIAKMFNNISTTYDQLNSYISFGMHHIWRKKAIKKAVSIAKKNDFIVIAGKGNENEIKYKKNIIKHNDFKVLKAILK